MSTGIAIFATGGGSNAQKIIEHFENSELADVRLIVTNNAEAFVLQRAAKHNIPAVTISKADFSDKKKMLGLLAKHNIDFIALAGFLLLIPEYLIDAFPKKIVNIHPALLPKYGGKGMYGGHVHQAVFDNNERESGITIHYVDAAYDEGAIIFQEKVALDTMDTPELIAKKVLALEHKHFAKVIEGLCKASL